ncbi:uncharacterized protein LOC141898348 [Tubulanus polymorphus]|uniref:uncharacterized protein LOC141898348 n=1 Tax=Tubulanus polymorphus TaxID=672921 RepID=UPI003DA332E3
MLICNYAPGSHTGYAGSGDPPFLEGEACSECPEGHPYCLGNALCASKSAVKNTDTKSECKVIPCLNGAVFDDESCSCLCPPGTGGVYCEESCKDLSDKCIELKDKQCSWDSQLYTFMSINCRVSCGLCGKVNGEFDSVNADKIKTNVRLINKTGDFDFAEAIKNAKDECIDKFPGSFCSRWTERGLCKSASIFMDFHCSKSCKRCKLMREPSVVNYGECKNKHDNDRQCDEWAYYGHCDKSPTWMRIFCSRSCNSCQTYKVGSCDNQYGNDAYCNAWALRGDCDTSEYWMKTFCASACDSCSWKKPQATTRPAAAVTSGQNRGGSEKATSLESADIMSMKELKAEVGNEVDVAEDKKGNDIAIDTGDETEKQEPEALTSENQEKAFVPTIEEKTRDSNKNVDKIKSS